MGKVLFNKRLTEADALIASSSNVDTIYFTSDTNRIIIGGFIYGKDVISVELGTSSNVTLSDDTFNKIKIAYNTDSLIYNKTYKNLCVVSGNESYLKITGWYNYAFLRIEYSINAITKRITSITTTTIKENTSAWTNKIEESVNDITLNIKSINDLLQNITNSVIFEDDGMYQKKDNEIYPVSHPDLSTQPSILPQRYGNISINEVVIPLSSIEDSIDEKYIPFGAMVIECTVYSSEFMCPASAQKTDGKWYITGYHNTLVSQNLFDDTEWWALVRYVESDNNYYYDYPLQDKDYFYVECGNNEQYNMTITAFIEPLGITNDLLEYSINNKNNWKKIGSGLTISDINSTTIVYFRFNNTDYGQHLNNESGGFRFNVNSDTVFSIGGCIKSLYYGENFTRTTYTAGENYASIFIYNIRNLLNASDLDIGEFGVKENNINGYCESMFRGCRQLQHAPKLTQPILYSNCYAYMFYDCIELNYVEMLGENIDTPEAVDCLNNWLTGCASNGILKISQNTQGIDINSIKPSGWVINY